MTLKISLTLLDQLRRRGEVAYPHECCGVLVGEFDEKGGKAVKAVIECSNTRTDSPENRYNISPSELVRIQREALLTGHDIVGFYHSHPDHSAQWSATDLAEAHWARPWLSILRLPAWELSALSILMWSIIQTFSGTCCTTPATWAVSRLTRPSTS
jgi:proteasome lid subunit RPN8/RPN11